MTGAIDKEGIDTGRKAINPFTGQEVPIWIANFVLAEYGTGAIMAVPAHDQRDFEFARKYNLPVRIVVRPDASRSTEEGAVAGTMTEASTNYGRLVDSGEYTGQEAPAVIARMTADAEKRGIGTGEVRYRLKDWGVSRQRRARPSLSSENGMWASMRQLPVEAAEGDDVVGQGDSPRRMCRVRQREVPEVRRSRTPRNRHDGYVRRFVVVLPALRRSGQQRAAVRPGRGRLLDAGGLLQRRRRACDSAPVVLPVLHPGSAGRRSGEHRRAVQAAAHAGDGAERQRRQSETQRRRSDDMLAKWRRLALCDVCAPPEGSRVERFGLEGSFRPCASGIVDHWAPTIGGEGCRNAATTAPTRSALHRKTHDTIRRHHRIEGGCTSIRRCRR